MGDFRGQQGSHSWVPANVVGLKKARLAENGLTTQIQPDYEKKFHKILLDYRGEYKYMEKHRDTASL
jgi:hypothetical protein